MIEIDDQISPKVGSGRGDMINRNCAMIGGCFFVGILSLFFFDTWLDGGLEYVFLSFTLKNEGKFLC